MSVRYGLVVDDGMGLSEHSFQAMGRGPTIDKDYVDNKD